jgi:hypothetical protein
MEYAGPLFKLVLLSILIERFLAVFFDLSVVTKSLQANFPISSTASGQASLSAFKGLIAAAVGVSICLATDFDVVNAILTSNQNDAQGNPLYPIVLPLNPVMAQFMTGVIIAGGSQGSVKLFQDILGFSKDNRDLMKQTVVKQQKAAQEIAETEKKAAEAEGLKQQAAINQLTVAGTATRNGKAPFDDETEALLAKAVPSASERAILRQVTARIASRSNS